MVIHTMYKRKIKHYNHIFDDTVRLYRGAVDYLISVCMDRWTEIAVSYTHLTLPTNSRV